MKKSKLVALLLVVIMVLSGCGGSGGGSSENSKTLVIAIQDEIEGTDIQQIGWDNLVHQLIYSPLITFNDDLSKLQPCFAKDFEISEDGLEVTFHLFEDSKFSNGDSLTAESVKKSVERMKEISEYAGDVEAIKEIKVVNDTTLKYILSEPAAYMWASLTSNFGGVVNAGKAEEMGNDEFNRAAVANGPYMVKEWQAGSQIVLEKNPYFKTANPSVTNTGVGDFDEIIIRFIPDQFTRVSELESGNVDIIYDVPAASIGSLKGNSDISTFEYKQAGSTYIMMQTEDAPLNNKLIREAINVGIDRDALSDALDNVVSPLYGFISSAQAGYSEEKEVQLADTYKHDETKAKKLLKQAGYSDNDGDGFVDKNGKNLTIEYASPTDKASSKAAAPVIQEQLKNIGIDLQIKEYEQAYIKQLVRDNKYQMASRNYLWNDADILYYVFTEESGYPWHDPLVTKTLKEARYITDADKRVKKYEEAQDALFDKMPAVSLFADNYCIAARNNIKGLVITNDGRSIYNDVTKE
ncbi:MAG: ABC transporter substrate-binding protein [Eubacteriales bacterium]|nr:ABC transporter substrate-binding protein [Eubacteriales bacterium]